MASLRRGTLMVRGGNDGTIHVGMDARSGFAALLGPAPPCAAQPPVPPSTMPPGINPLAGQRGEQPILPRPMASPVGPGVGQGRPELPPALPMPPATLAPARGTTGMRTSPLATPLNLKAAPLESTDLRFPINLATALRLSDARPLIVAAAQAGVWVAEARAHAGQGPLGPDAQHRLRLYPPRRRRPGLQQGHHDRAQRELLLRWCWHVGDHLHDRRHLPAPGRAAVLNARQWDIQSAKNDALYMTANAYFTRPPVPGHVYRRPLLRRAGP